MRGMGVDIWGGWVKVPVMRHGCCLEAGGKCVEWSGVGLEFGGVCVDA